MLFPSYSFLLLFLPATLVAYWLKPHIGVLIIASLIFYAMWNPLNVLLLIASFSFNYFVGWVIPRANRPRQVMALGIAANLCVLALYKYSDGALPLGISFFTFTQIGYLVDCLSGRWKKVQFLDFVFFVTFFPHLIAGPILHVREILQDGLDALLGLLADFRNVVAHAWVIRLFAAR